MQGTTPSRAAIPGTPVGAYERRTKAGTAAGDRGGRRTGAAELRDEQHQERREHRVRPGARGSSRPATSRTPSSVSAFRHTQMRADVGADAALVPLAGGRLDIERLQVAVQQLVHRGVGSWRLAIVDLLQEPRTDLLRG
jgi:hypothetical protein